MILGQLRIGARSTTYAALYTTYPIFEYIPPPGKQLWIYAVMLMSVGTVGPALESMRAREPGLQAPGNLAGSKIKSTQIFFPSLFLSQILNILKQKILSRPKLKYASQH